MFRSTLARLTSGTGPALRTALMAAVLTLPVGANAAAEEGGLPSANINVTDVSSLQRGAKLFVNYCLSCHSAEYMRYNRLAEDLGLGEDLVMRNLVFADAKIGDTMAIAMRDDDAAGWFGKAPPDLSLIGRSRGADWIYAYLTSFYRDENGAWNNTVLENAAMPHVLWPLQGIQSPVYETHEENGVEVRRIAHLEMETPGRMSPEDYDRAARDMAAFLDYLSEPAKLKRKNIGIWVMLYLAVLAFLAYLLKAEFWRDVH